MVPIATAAIAVTAYSTTGSGRRSASRPPKIPEREERQGQPDQRRPDEGRAAKKRREETACGELNADRGEAAGKHQDAQERRPGNAPLGAAMLIGDVLPEARQPRVSRPQGFRFRPLGEASPSCFFALDALSEHVASAGWSIVLVPASGFLGRHATAKPTMCGALTLIARRSWDVRVLTSSPMRVG